jgi:hypothetical protein
MSYYDNGYDLLMQGVDPHDNDDPENYITEEGKCYLCGYQFDVEELDSLFVVEESGVDPGLHFGPDVHWATGYIVCPNCKDQLPYEVQS